MILRDCEWVDEPGEELPKAPKKRRVTEAMAAASRANGAKSKGPTTDTGREKVKFNAVRHGAACKEIVFLPGEDEGAFWARVDRAISEQGADGELEIEAIINALYSRVTKERAINAQAIAVTEARTKIEENYDKQKLEELTGLIEKIALSPQLTVKKLMDSTCGCAFLTRELKGIYKHLIKFNSLCPTLRSYCLQLTGHRPDDLFTDPVVRKLNRAYLAALQLEPGDVTNTMAAEAFQGDCPAEMSKAQLIELMTPLVTDLPTADQGRKWLKKFVKGHLDRLKERTELMGYREQRELSAALGVAQAPCDRESVTRDRYITQGDRTFNTAVRMLLALKQERRKHGDESRADRNGNAEAMATTADVGHQGPDAASTPEEMAPQAEAIPAVNEEKVNEPEPTQVVAQPAANNAPGAGPASPQGPQPQVGALDHAAIRAAYRPRVEKTMRDFNECTETGPPRASENS